MPKELLERQGELSRGEAALERAAGGEGAVLALEGPAGIGKTRLVGELVEIARRDGFRVHLARGADLEGELPFGVARQLFEPPLAALPADRRSELLSGAAALAAPVLGQPHAPPPGGLAPDQDFAALHGLYWLCANLAETQPTLLAIDDAHLADRESIRWLGYLSNRIDALPIAITVALRPGEPRTRGPELEPLIAQPATERIEPEPLSEAAVEKLAAEAFGRPAEPEFAGACHEASGGNPFLAGELLRELAEHGIEPTAANADRTRTTGPERVRRSLLARLSALPAACRELAIALAVCGQGTDLATVARLAELDLQAAEEAADLLVAASILSPEAPPSFRHAILRSAVYEDLSPFKRAQLHARAARAIAAAPVPDPERIAVQLISSEPAGDAWVVERLRDAARQALAKGAPETAVEHYERALAEPPPPELEGELLAELGVAEQLSWRMEGAIEHLRGALARTDDPVPRAELSRPLATALVLSGGPTDAVAAVELLAEAIERLPPGARELRLRLEGDIAVVAQGGYRASRTADRRPIEQIELRPGEQDARPVLAALAWRESLRGRVADAGRLALEACGEGRLLAEEGPVQPPFYVGAAALTLAHELDAARAEYTRAMNAATELGSSWAASLLTAARALVHHRLGQLRMAEADARAYLDFGERASPQGAPLALAALIGALVDRGALDAAEAAPAEYRGVELHGEWIQWGFLHWQRARLKMVQRRHREALVDLRACARHEEHARIENPTMSSWRSDAALCLEALGEEGAEHAAGLPVPAELIADELRRARAFGALRPLGIALRAAGLLSEGTKRIELLEESVEIHAEGPDRVEHARSLADLGTALRLAGDRKRARATLDEALNRARECGARLIGERAHAELAAAGIKRRKILESGLDALTASERRVAELAASGGTNREIAEQCFITTKTVETHLYRAYRKLGISSRKELIGALERG